MGQYNAESGIKVLDRSVAILNTVATHPKTLLELAEHTGLPRATAHRLATALEAHRFISRSSDGRWSIGPALVALASGGQSALIEAATPIMAELLDATGESVQLYQLTGNTRTCIAAKEPSIGLRNTVPVGSQLSLESGSAARVFAAFGASAAAFPAEDMTEVREHGWAESVAEREVGLASLSAPVFDSAGSLVAVLSISGPEGRLAPSPGAKWANALTTAAEKLSAAL